MRSIKIMAAVAVAALFIALPIATAEVSDADWADVKQAVHFAKNDTVSMTNFKNVLGCPNDDAYYAFFMNVAGFDTMPGAYSYSDDKMELVSWEMCNYNAVSQNSKIERMALTVEVTIGFTAKAVADIPGFIKEEITNRSDLYDYLGLEDGLLKANSVLAISGTLKADFIEKQDYSFSEIDATHAALNDVELLDAGIVECDLSVTYTSGDVKKDFEMECTDIWDNTESYIADVGSDVEPITIVTVVNKNKVKESTTVNFIFKNEDHAEIIMSNVGEGTVVERCAADQVGTMYMFSVYQAIGDWGSEVPEFRTIFDSLDIWVYTPWGPTSESDILTALGTAKDTDYDKADGFFSDYTKVEETEMNKTLFYVLFAVVAVIAVGIAVFYRIKDEKSEEKTEE